MTNANALAAAALLASGAAIDWRAISDAKRAYERAVLSGGRRGRRFSDKNDDARSHGIPKWLRQHASRHGVSVDEIVQTHKQFPALMLDHARDRRLRQMARLA